MLVATFAVRESFIVVISLWVARYYVPAMEQSGEVSKTTKEDVDQ
jgi:hypothetical protein